MRFGNVTGSVILLAGSVGVSTARAEMVTFVFTGTGSGSLDGVSFVDSSFTFTGVADTANRIQFTNAWLLEHTAASISIDGLGTLSVSTLTSTAVNNSNQSVVFGNRPANLALYIEGPDPAFSTWDLLTSIGPLPLQGELLQWFQGPLQTSGGQLLFGNRNTVGTFQATVVPEPCAVAMVLGGLGAYRRRKRAEGATSAAAGSVTRAGR